MPCSLLALTSYSPPQRPLTQLLYAPPIYPLTPSNTATRQKTLRRISALIGEPIWLAFFKKGRSQGQTIVLPGR